MILNVIRFILIYYFLVTCFLFIKQKADFHNGKVIQRRNLLAHAFQIIIEQLQFILKGFKNLWNIWRDNKLSVEVQERKSNVLINVVNHLNQKLESDLGIKTTSPATTRGVDVWVYLSNKLNEAEKEQLEDYFIGVLTKYTAEFALDILIIDLNAGAGWVAKFDVKQINEANYNRMARNADITIEEDF